MITIDLQERLSWLDKNLVQASNEYITLEETRQDGRALLQCKLENYCISFNKIENMKIPHFVDQKCADALVFERLPNGNWVVHVLEFKRKVTPEKWGDIKKQFSSAVRRALLFMGILGITNVNKIKCYTAYRAETLSTNPTLLKARTGFTQNEIDWLTDNIHLDIINQRVEHKRITLDTEGYGEVTLH